MAYISSSTTSFTLTEEGTYVAMLGNVNASASIKTISGGTYEKLADTSSSNPEIIYLITATSNTCTVTTYVPVLAGVVKIG